MAGRSVDGVHWADLDGLRALAILLVVARHSLRPFISEDDYQSVATLGSLDLTPILLNGWIGVDLFFVLSGFLIGRQAWKGDSLWRFWFKRVTRILPAYWACLAVVALALTLSGAWAGRGLDFLAHVVMLQDYTGSVFVAAFWSLGAEEKFYLLAPLLIVLLSCTRHRWWQGAGLAALWCVPVLGRLMMAADAPSAIGYTEYFFRFRSPFHLTCESLVVGLTIAWLSLRFQTRLTRPVREVCFWLGTAGAVYWLTSGLILERIDTHTIVLSPAVIGLCFGLMVLACIGGQGSYSAWLGRGLWRPVATGSYAVYLTHMMIIPVASAFALIYPMTPIPSIAARWLAFLPWYLLLTAASAYVLHRLVERPVLVWRDRFLSHGHGSSERFSTSSTPPRKSAA